MSNCHKSVWEERKGRRFEKIKEEDEEKGGEEMRGRRGMEEWGQERKTKEK